MQVLFDELGMLQTSQDVGSVARNLFAAALHYRMMFRANSRITEPSTMEKCIASAVYAMKQGVEQADTFAYAIAILLYSSNVVGHEADAAVCAELGKRAQSVLAGISSYYNGTSDACFDPLGCPDMDHPEEAEIVRQTTYFWNTVVQEYKQQ